MNGKPAHILVAILLVTLLLVASNSLIGRSAVNAQPSYDTEWLKLPANVAWTSTGDTVYLVINDGTTYGVGGSGTWDRGGRKWQAYFIVADNVPNVYAGIFDLREEVYYDGAKRLDEGYWDPNGVRQGYLFDSKQTVQGSVGIQTTWIHTWTGFKYPSGAYTTTATMTRIVSQLSGYQKLGLCGYGPNQGVLINYTISISDNATPTGRTVGIFGFAITWYAGGDTIPDMNTVSDSLGNIECQTMKAQERLMTNADGTDKFPGIIDPNLKFDLSFSFDDSMKTHQWTDSTGCHTGLHGWDGATCNDFWSQGIYYDQDAYSPVTDAGAGSGVRPDPAIMGMNFAPAITIPPLIEMENCVDGQYVGPIGMEWQRVHIIF